MLKQSIFSIMVIASASKLLGCCIIGSGDVEKETREVADFHRISVDTQVGTIFVSRGDTQKVTVRTDDNIMKRISTKVRNNTLYIDKKLPACIDPTTLRISIRVPELDKLSIDGSANVVFEDPFEGETLKIEIDGSGDILSEHVMAFDDIDVIMEGSGDVVFEVDTAKLRTVVEGSADFTYSGFAARHVIEIEGSGNIRAFDLETDVTTVDIDGSGSCRVSVADALDVDISGSGDVYFRGDPDVEKKISGSGKVKQTD